ncbi:MAG: Uma2 family endonuclease [Blastocatellia bacterium]
MENTITEAMPAAPYKLDEEIQREMDAYYEQVEVEDDEPVDGILSAKQMRLLVSPLYSSWTPPPRRGQAEHEKRPFLADVNVGVFYSISEPPIVPDFFLSLDVRQKPDWHEKKNLAYFIWERGKPPDIAVEIVSNREGGELAHKPGIYAMIGVRYYVVYDPLGKLRGPLLQMFVIGEDGEYKFMDGTYMSRIGLGLTLWEGVFEGFDDTWLRWVDSEGNLILTGEELALQEAERADQETERADQEAERADREAAARREAEEQAARLTQKLRELGLDPERV